MKILIENYRGFDIQFDTEQEVFYSFSDSYDTESTNKSFSSAKKYIDDYIKNNTEFKPFWIERHPSPYNDRKKIFITGIRKDGKFTYEHEKGGKSTISQYDEKDWMLSNPLNEPFFNEYDEITKQINALNEKRKEVSKKFICVDLKQIKSNYIK